MSRKQEELNHSNELDIKSWKQKLLDSRRSGVVDISISPDAQPDDPRLLDLVQVETRDEGALFVQRSQLIKRNLELGGIIPGLETRTLLSHEEWDQCCGRSKT
jgi:hypothetical protein